MAGIMYRDTGMLVIKTAHNIARTCERQGWIARSEMFPPSLDVTDALLPAGCPCPAEPQPAGPQSPGVGPHRDFIPVHR